MTVPSWETTVDGERRTLVVTDDGILVGRGSGHGESAARVDPVAVLAGAIDDDVGRVHGAVVLRDLVDEVRARWPKLLPVKTSASLRRVLARVPPNPKLADFARERPDDWGELHYVTAGTTLRSDSRTLIYGGSTGVLRADVAAQRPANLVDFGSGAAADGIAWRDHFYVVCGRSFVVIGPDGAHLERPEDRSLFGTELRIVGVRRLAGLVCFLYQWFGSGRPVDGFLQFDARTRTFGGRYAVLRRAKPPSRPPVPSTRTWSWKRDAGTEMSCVLQPTGVLDWSGDELHGPFKGPFGVAVQSFDDFLVDGPPPPAGAPPAIATAIREHLVEGGWPAPGAGAAAQREKEALRRKRVLAREARRQTAERTSTQSPVESGSSWLQVIARMTPPARLAGLTLRLGSHVLYQGGGAVPLAETAVLAYQGPVRAGRHALGLDASVLDPNGAPRALPALVHGLSIPPRTSTMVELSVGEDGLAVHRMRTAGMPRLVLRLRVVPDAGQRLIAVRAKLDDCLVAHDVPRSEIPLFDGFTSPGSHVVSVRTRFLVAGEVDPRERRDELDVEVAPAGLTALERQVVLETIPVSPDQAEKRARIEELERALAQAIRDGGVYSWGDREGNIDELRFEGGRFLSWRGAIANEAELAERVVEYERGFETDRLRILESALDRIRRYASRA